MNEDNQEILKNSLEYLKNIEKNIQLGRFRIDSTSEVDFILQTDNNGIFAFSSNGNSFFTTSGCSTEIIGRNIKNKGVPAKIIKAKRGDIWLIAEDGDIYLQAKNVKTFATDVEGGQIILDSTKTVSINSSIAKVNSEYCTITASSDLSTAGATNSSHAVISNENTTEAEESNGSIFSRILSAVKKFRTFFEPTCR